MPTSGSTAITLPVERGAESSADTTERSDSSEASPAATSAHTRVDPVSPLEGRTPR